MKRLKHDLSANLYSHNFYYNSLFNHKIYMANDQIARLILEALGVSEEVAPVLHSTITTAKTSFASNNTRMIKVFCETCGYIARTSRSNILRIGAPICPCNNCAMSVDKKLTRN